MLKWLYGLVRPICPDCDGSGGGMSGYYQPEFYGCRCCNEDEDNEDEVTRVWRWQWWAYRIEQWKHDRWIERHMMSQEELERELEVRYGIEREHRVVD